MSKNIKKVAVTGSNSMMGRSIVSALKENYDVYELTHNELNLLDYKNTLKFFYLNEFDYCVHCAGYNGNIQFNKDFPADIFFKTAQMGLNVLTVCRMSKVKKIVSLISSCAYPDNGNGILKEKNFWQGEPNPTVDAHGFSKRILMEYGRQISKHKEITHVGVIVNTGYGPYDNYDVNKTKVVGGLIKKFILAKETGQRKVECWGTGNPRREFIYCEDVGINVVRVLEEYNDTKYPINIGSGLDYSIKELAETIAQEVGFNGDIIFDHTKPDGQMKKLLDNTLMKEQFGDIEFTGLKQGIKRTIYWYENFYNNSHD